MIQNKNILGGLFILSAFIADVNEKNSMTLPLSYLEASLERCQFNPLENKQCKEAFDFLEKELIAQKSNIVTKKNEGNNYLEKVTALKKQLFQSNSNHSAFISDALNVWLQAADPHARLIRSEEEKSSAENTTIEVKGIGVKARSYKNKVIIAYVMEGSTAEAAGLKSGQEILAINGKTLLNFSKSKQEEILKQFRNPYHLIVQDKNKIFPVTLEKRDFAIENISWIKIGSLGSIRVRSFAKANTCDELSHAVDQLEKNGVTKFEIDIRNNPGGYVTQAKCAAGLFLGPGHLFANLRKIKNFDDLNIPAAPIGTLSKQDFVSLFTEEDQITHLPLIIRINGNTASAAEMFAAALQDDERAIVVGNRSFGKGSMQSPFHPWNNENLLLFRTTHFIDRPSGKTLQYAGVTPDLITEKAESSSLPREIDLTQ